MVLIKLASPVNFGHPVRNFSRLLAQTIVSLIARHLHQSMIYLRASPNSQYQHPTYFSTIDSSSSAMPTLALLQSHSHNQSRREKNRRTTAVLQVFDQVDLEIDACNAKLTQTPSVNVLNEVQSALDVLHPRVAQVTRKAPSIDVRKRQICEHLISLDARIAEWKYLLKVKEPISYNSGKDNLSYLPPSWC